MLTSPVGHVGKREWVALISDRLPQTRSRQVVVIAQFAEGIPAALRTAVRTDSGSTVSALRHGSLAAWHTDVTIAVSVFDLAVHCSTSAQASSHECQPATGSLCRSRSNNSSRPSI